jgi:hypothetical protein
MFGLSVPAEILKKQGKPVRYWGARAIFHPDTAYPIDLLPDRQGYQSDELDPKPLLDWLNKFGLPELKKLPTFKNLDTSSREVVEVKQGQFTLQASPQGSYGYLYIGAWQYWPEGCKYNQQQIDPTAKWSGKGPIPAIGDKIVALINGRWEGKVTGYFVEHGYQGIEVACTKRPDWKAKQEPDDNHCLFFGIDLQQTGVATPA